jgi:hypothetical protein
LGKRWSVNKKIARNREFHGIGHEVEKMIDFQHGLCWTSGCRKPLKSVTQFLIF